MNAITRQFYMFAVALTGLVMGLRLVPGEISTKLGGGMSMSEVMQRFAMLAGMTVIGVTLATLKGIVGTRAGFIAVTTFLAVIAGHSDNTTADVGFLLFIIVLGGLGLRHKPRPVGLFPFLALLVAMGALMHWSRGLQSILGMWYEQAFGLGVLILFFILTAIPPKRTGTAWIIPVGRVNELEPPERERLAEQLGVAHIMTAQPESWKEEGIIPSLESRLAYKRRQGHRLLILDIRGLEERFRHDILRRDNWGTLREAGGDLLLLTDSTGGGVLFPVVGQPV